MQKQEIPDDIAKRVISVFGDSVTAERWLNTPINVLNGDSPMVRLHADKGLEEIRTILLKIECGEFS